MNKSAVGGIMILIGGFNLLLVLRYVFTVGLSKLSQVELLAGLGAGGLTALGLVLFIMGRSAAAKLEAKAALLRERGVETDAVVTYVDRNYSVSPIYCLV